MPATVDQRLEAAARLDLSGQDAAARAAYLAILLDAPDHAGTLNHLGALLLRTGYSRAARTAFARATLRHPGLPHGHVNLAHLLREDGEAAAARLHYAAALRLVPDLPEAHQGMGNVLFDAGDSAGAEQHWRLGYRDRVFAPWPYRGGAAAPVRVLLLASVRGGNIPAQPLLDPTVFAVTTVALEFFAVGQALPPHDVVFNAAGDADLCRPALLAAAALLAGTAAPVVNRPEAVLATGRAANAARLAAVPGVVVPRLRCWPRAALLAADAAMLLAEAGFGWPLLLRAPGFHTGRHFIRVAAPADLPGAVAALPGADLLVIEYIPPQQPDGLARKYRAMFVDGRILPLHLAISRDWKVHYFTAAMADNAAHRAEEQCYLDDMAGHLGARAMAALAAISLLLGLDYGGIDFALAADGSLVLFEANATMALVPPTAEPIWDYRRPAIAAVREATRRMLCHRAGIAGT